MLLSFSLAFSNITGQSRGICVRYTRGQVEQGKFGGLYHSPELSFLGDTFG